MRIAVASGKGGAGKTSVAVSLVLCRGSGTIADCDVEEPNVSILLKPQIEGSKRAFKPTPYVDESLCDHCGLCAQVCQFNALLVLPEKVVVFDKLCHSCGACVYMCPKNAIGERDREIGIVEWGRRGGIGYVAGRLNVGEAMATPLVEQVKDTIYDQDFVVVDAPPGITCPVVEALEGADFVVAVAESSPFGLEDFKGLLEFLQERKFRFGVLENKRGLCGDALIEEFCRERGITYLGAIPYSNDVARSYAKGVPLIESWEYGYAFFSELMERIEELIS